MLTECFFFLHFSGFYLCIYFICDIHNTFYKFELQARSREFFFTAFCPKTICQVVMFYRTVLLDRSISAMMIGQDKSVGRNNFSGTSSAKDTYCIFQRNIVGVVDVVGIQLQTLCFHAVCQVLFLHELQQPHTFVCL